MISPVRQLFPLYIVSDIESELTFYRKYFSFSVIFRSEEQVHLVNEAGAQLAFMKAHLQSKPQAIQVPFDTNGAILTFEVDDAQFEFERLQQEGIPIVLPYTEEEFGQKHFFIKDPAGIIVNILEVAEI